jgi:hypothetical protein
VDQIANVEIIVNVLQKINAILNALAIINHQKLQDVIAVPIVNVEIIVSALQKINVILNALATIN